MKKPLAVEKAISDVHAKILNDAGINHDDTG